MGHSLAGILNNRIQGGNMNATTKLSYPQTEFVHAMARFWFPLRWLLISLALVGCNASPFSAQLRKEAKQQPSFAQISANPSAYRGQHVILGGSIVQTTNQARTTEIEILQRPLDSYDDRPEDTDQSFGRFLARCPGFLDSAIYAKGREVTIAGEIQGREERPLDQTQYPYPVVQCRQIHLWPSQPPNAYYYPYYYGGWGPWGRGWPGYYPYWYPYW